jgi:hypothetical protein
MGLITVMGQRKVADILLNLEVEGRKQNTAQEAAGADYDHVGNAHGTLSSSDITSRAGGTCLQWVADGCKCDPQAASSSFVEELQYLLINVQLTTNSS